MPTYDQVLSPNAQADLGSRYPGARASWRQDAALEMAEVPDVAEGGTVGVGQAFRDAAAVLLATIHVRVTHGAGDHIAIVGHRLVAGGRIAHGALCAVMVAVAGASVDVRAVRRAHPAWWQILPAPVADAREPRLHDVVAPAVLGIGCGAAAPDHRVHAALAA